MSNEHDPSMYVTRQCQSASHRIPEKVKSVLHWCCSVFHCISKKCTLLHCIGLHCAVLHWCSVFHCFSVFHCCSVLHCEIALILCITLCNQMQSRLWWWSRKDCIFVYLNLWWSVLNCSSMYIQFHCASHSLHFSSLHCDAIYFISLLQTSHNNTEYKSTTRPSWLSRMSPSIVAKFLNFSLSKNVSMHSKSTSA